MCCQVGITVSQYQVQSLRTWHVSGIDGDDAGPHGEDEPRRSEAGSTSDAGSITAGRDWIGAHLDVSSFSQAKENREERRGR